jgi:hypothetical protein
MNPGSYHCKACGWSRVILADETVDQAREAHERTDIHRIDNQARALRARRTTPEQVIANLTVCMESPTLKHNLYDGAAGGQVCVWCHYGEEN